jgi:hypothetical protein
MTPTLTPTLTPTPNEIVSVINNCEVQTLFDMGIRCNVEKSPTTSTSNDGILSILVTGGTSPYKVFWNGKQGNQRLLGVGQGSYPVTVVDYYGDYTANTICSLIAPTPTPPPTATPLPTATPTPLPNLCFIYQGTTVSYGPITLTWNGSMLDVNGKPTWSGTYDGANLTLEWVTQSTRWEIKGWSSIPGWNSNQGIPVSIDTSNPPLANWSIVGGQAATTTMIQGVCPLFLPLRAFVNKQDSTCPNKNDGSITITADAGVKGSGYSYSIDGGTSYSSTNIFNNLSPNTYSVVVKDNASPPNITPVNQVSIINLNQITNYTFSIQLLNQYSTGAGNKTFDWKLDINPKLKLGMACQIRLLNVTSEYLYQPGLGTFSSVSVFKKNGNIVPLAVNSNQPQGQFPRPNCNSSYTLYAQTNVSSPIIVGYNDIISGTSVYDLTITNFQTNSAGCSTLLEQRGWVAVDKTQGPLVTTGFTVCDNISFAPRIDITNSLP